MQQTMFPLGILPVTILLFQFILPIESSQTVVQYETDFSEVVEFDSPDCKGEGKRCEVGECCHTMACRHYPAMLHRRCQVVENYVTFSSKHMESMKFVPYKKEGENCENHICKKGTKCFKLPDRRKICMSSKVRYPPPPCYEEGESCKTGKCCQGNFCYTYIGGHKECRKNAEKSKPTAATYVQETEPVVQQTEPVVQEINCVGEGQKCYDGLCCKNLNLLCTGNVHDRMARKGVCKYANGSPLPGAPDVLGPPELCAKKDEKCDLYTCCNESPSLSCVRTAGIGYNCT